MSATIRGGTYALVALIALAGRAPAAEPDSTGDAPAGRSADAPIAPATGSPETLYRLDPLRIRAHRLPDPLDPFPLASTQLGAREIARLPGANLEQLLRPVTGLRLSSHGLAEAGGSLSIRGSTTDEVVVLLDGRRLSTAQGGGVDVCAISLDAVESVDVVRGGASALFGPDALGGAIDVRTKPVRPGFRGRVAGGSFGERAASGEAGLASGPWGLRLAGRTYATNGDFPFRDDGTGVESVAANGDVHRSSGELRAERALPGARLVVDASAFDQRRGVPGSEEFPSPTARLADRRYTAGVSLAGTSASRRLGGDLSFVRQTRRYQEPAAAFGAVDDEHENTRVRAEASLDRVGGRAALRAAAGVTTDRLESTTDGRRRRGSADVRAQVSSDRGLGDRVVRFLGAARLDALQGFDPFVSPRAGVLVDVVPRRVRLSASAGLAYRAPSFDELFWPPRASAAGNPTLRAEHGKDVELAAQADELPAEARVSFAAFGRDVEDLIQWIPGPDGVWRPHNLGDARLWGLEADASVRVPVRRNGVELTASGTMLRSEDRSGEPNVSGKDLVYRPRWTSALAVRLEDALGGELETIARGTADVFVTRANTKRLPGYLMIDVRWRRPLPRGLGVDLAVTNLSDVAARDFRDYPLPGRAMSLGLSWEGGRR
ncbi:MAG: TonB-dependent receptor [bacterium]